MIKNIRTLLIEDEKLVAESICSQLDPQSNGEVNCLGYYVDGEKGVEAAIEIEPDVVLIDLFLPKSNINGFIAGYLIRREKPAIKLITLTKGDRPYQPVNLALKLGFTGYFLKERSIVELISTIRAVATNGLSLSGSLSEFLPGRNSYEKVLDLSERELEIAQLVKKGMTNESIAKRLFLSTETINQEISKIFQILNIENRTMLASYITTLEGSGLWNLLVDTMHYLEKERKTGK